MKVPNKVVIKMTAAQLVVQVFFDDGTSIEQTSLPTALSEDLIHYKKTTPGSFTDHFSQLATPDSREALELEFLADAIDALEASYVCSCLHDIANIK